MAEPFESFTSRVVPLPAENVDTDQIVPARYLKTTDKAAICTRKRVLCAAAAIISSNRKILPCAKPGGV